MIKKIITVFIVVIVLVGLYKITSKNPTPAENTLPDSSADLIIYWGNGCPHCENVKEYITENDIDSKLKINWKEVYENKDNQAEMVKTAKKCPEVDTTNGIGVPFAFSVSDQKCYIGDAPIIDWIEAKVSKQ